VTIQPPPEPPAPESAAPPAPPWYRHPLTFLAAGLILGGLIGVIIILVAGGDDTPATTTVVTTTTETVDTTAATTTPEAAVTTEAPVPTEPPSTTAALPGPEQWIGVEYAGDPPPGLYSRVATCLGDPLCSYALEVVGTEEFVPGAAPGVPLEFIVLLSKNVGSEGDDTLWRVVDAEEYTFSEPGVALTITDCYEGDFGGQQAVGIMDHPAYSDIYGVIAADLATETLHAGSGTGYVCAGGD